MAAEWPAESQTYDDAVVADKARDSEYYSARAEAKTEEDYVIAEASGEDSNAALRAPRTRLGLASAG